MKKVKKLLKYTEWESITGWHTGDVSDLPNGSNYWWHVPRMLNMDVVDYILMLKDKFHAIDFSYSKDKNVLLWQWKNYNDCHIFTRFVNLEARKRKYFI